jgi:hypothetical protein
MKYIGHIEVDKTKIKVMKSKFIWLFGDLFGSWELHCT